MDRNLFSVYFPLDSYIKSLLQQAHWHLQCNSIPKLQHTASSQVQSVEGVASANHHFVPSISDKLSVTKIFPIAHSKWDNEHKSYPPSNVYTGHQAMSKSYLLLKYFVKSCLPWRWPSLEWSPLWWLFITLVASRPFKAVRALRHEPLVDTWLIGHDMNATVE